MYVRRRRIIYGAAESDHEDHMYIINTYVVTLICVRKYMRFNQSAISRLERDPIGL